MAVPLVFAGLILVWKEGPCDFHEWDPMMSSLQVSLPSEPWAGAEFHLDPVSDRGPIRPTRVWVFGNPTPPWSVFLLGRSNQDPKTPLPSTWHKNFPPIFQAGLSNFSSWVSNHGIVGKRSRGRLATLSLGWDWERRRDGPLGMAPEAVATSDQWLLSAQPWPHTQIVRLLMPLAPDTGEAAPKSLEMKLGRLSWFLWDEAELCLLHTLPCFNLQMGLVCHPGWREARRPPRATLGWDLPLPASLHLAQSFLTESEWILSLYLSLICWTRGGWWSWTPPGVGEMRMALFVILSVEEGTDNYLSSLREPREPSLIQPLSEDGAKESRLEMKRAREETEGKDLIWVCACTHRVCGFNLGGSWGGEQKLEQTGRRRHNVDRRVEKRLLKRQLEGRGQGGSGEWGRRQTGLRRGRLHRVSQMLTTCPGS